MERGGKTAEAAADHREIDIEIIGERRALAPPFLARPGPDDALEGRVHAVLRVDRHCAAGSPSSAVDLEPEDEADRRRNKPKKRRAASRWSRAALDAPVLR